LVTLWNISNLDEPSHIYNFVHHAAVKAIAFCPWSKSLLATGGGLNDKCIRFWHTKTGTLLDTYDVKGQITSLVWSKHFRQIAATFGYNDTEIPLFIAVYTFPKCKPLIQVPAVTGNRALTAVSSPDGRCICLASSDETIRFYELWPLNGRKPIPESGVFDSKLIEMYEDTEQPWETIR
jgi:meiosis-specific APC/C activator protein AMA1